MDDIIEVKNVSKSFGGVQANIDISLKVKKGSITGIIGPNGCGKTTLFNSIVGYHPIDNGSIVSAKLLLDLSQFSQSTS